MLRVSQHFKVFFESLIYPNLAENNFELLILQVLPPLSVGL